MKSSTFRTCLSALLALALLLNVGWVYGAAEPNELDPAKLLALPFPINSLEFDVEPLHFRLVRADDVPNAPPENELNDLPACMVGFEFGNDFSEGSLEARKAVYGAATLLAQDGREYGVYASGAHEHDRWDLYFGLPETLSVYDCVLILRLPDNTVTWPLGGYEYREGSRRPAAAIGEGGEALPLTAANAGADQAPAAQAMSVENAALVEAERAVQAVKSDTDEPWETEILANTHIALDEVGEPDRRGYTPVTMTATMPGMLSGVKSGAKLGDQDATAFLQAALNNAQTETVSYSLKILVNLDNAEETLRWDKSKNQKGLARFVATKATAARKSFEVAALRDAVAALLVDEAVTRGKLDASKGLTAVKLSGRVSQNTGALNAAQEDVYEELANVPLANGWDQEAIRGAFDEQYAKRLKRSNKKTNVDFSFDVDLLALMEFGRESCGDAVAFAAQPDPYDITMDALCAMVWALPDYPRPETGRLSGESRGTRVTVRVGDGPGDVFVRFVHAGSEDMQVSCYIREGGRCTVRVPSGDYELRYGRGDAMAWQGEENAFGSEGAYGYGDLQVKGSNYEHTVTLEFVEDGNMPVSGTSLDGFLGR